MPINPNIAMGVQGIQLNNPLDAYAKAAQIQSAQNQNALAQYQLAAAQRQDAVQNALNDAWGQYDPNTGDTGPMVNRLRERGAASAIPDVMKKIEEGKEAKTKGQKAQVDLIDSKLKQSRAFLDTIDPNDPNAAQQYIQWHEANHSDPVLGPVLASRGITAEQSRARIEAALQQPGGLQTLINQSKLGSEKFIQMNKPTVYQQSNGVSNRMVSIPGMGGAATVVPGSEQTMQMTPYQKAQLELARQRENRLDAKDKPTTTTSPTGEKQSPFFNLAKDVAEYKTDIKVAMSRLKGAEKEAFAAEVRRQNPDYDGTLFATKQASAKAFASGPDGNMLRALGTANAHIDQMIPLVENLDSTDSKSVNKVAQWMQKEFGLSTAPSNYEMIKTILAKEAAKAFVPNGGSMQERQSLEGKLAADMQGKSLKEALGVLKNAMQAQSDSLVLKATKNGVPKSLIPDYSSVGHGSGNKETSSNKPSVSNW